MPDHTARPNDERCHCAKAQRCSVLGTLQSTLLGAHLDALLGTLLDAYLGTLLGTHLDAHLGTLHNPLHVCTEPHCKVRDLTVLGFPMLDHTMRDATDLHRFEAHFRLVYTSRQH